MDDKKNRNELDKRLSHLKALFEKGVISESEFEYKRLKLMDAYDFGKEENQEKTEVSMVQMETVEVDPDLNMPENTILEVFQQDMVLIETVEPSMVMPEPAEAEAAVDLNVGERKHAEKLVAEGTDVMDEMGACVEVADEMGTSESLRRGKSKTVKKVIVAIVAAAAVFAGAFVYLSTPKEMVINDGEMISVYVDEESQIRIEGGGIDKKDIKDVEWDLGKSSKLLTIEKGVIKASYDEKTFADKSSCRCRIKGSLKKGIRSWNGKCTVMVSLKEVPFVNGYLVKKAKEPRPATIKFAGYSDRSACVYLKSTVEDGRDIAFMVEAGKAVEHSVPEENYVMYIATGQTWYGSEYLFGPDTRVVRLKKEISFSAGEAAFDARKLKGRKIVENVEPAEFPR